MGGTGERHGVSEGAGRIVEAEQVKEAGGATQPRARPLRHDGKNLPLQERMDEGNERIDRLGIDGRPTGRRHLADGIKGRDTFANGSKMSRLKTFATEDLNGILVVAVYKIGKLSRGRKFGSLFHAIGARDTANYARKWKDSFER